MFPALVVILGLVSGANAGARDQSPVPSDSLAARDALAAPSIVELDKAAMNASPFAAAAQGEGISVSTHELKQRVGLYSKLYPGHEVDSEQVREIVLAEKYLEAKGIRSKEAGPDSDSGSAADASRFAAPGEAELAKKTVGLHLLLDREDVRRQGEKLEEFAQLRLSSEQKPLEMRPLSELQLQGDPEECLAWAGRDCFLTLQEYNAAAAYYPMPGTIPLGTARTIILKRYLQEKRLAANARTLGLDRKADSAMQRVLNRKRDLPWIQSALAFGKPVQDMSLLQAAYGKYYGRYFAPGEDVTLAVIGSSDSAYIDSLYRVLRAGYGKRTADRNPGRRPAAKPALPWSYFQERQLPQDLIARADTLKVGQCSSPHRSPFGYFLVRLAKAAPTPEVSFDNAYPQVVFLATRDRFLGMDSLAEAQAKRYYAMNIGQFAWPDTLGLRAWLIPRQEAPTPGMARRTGKAPVLADTARFKALELSSLALPPGLRISLQEQARKDSAKTFFGPFSDGYGRWYFQIRSRKPARGVLPFRLARKEILDRIGAPPEEEGSGTASEEALGEVGFNFALAQAYRQAQHRKQMEKDEKARHAEGGAGLPADLPRPEGMSESEQAKASEDALVRIRAEETKRRAEEDRLLKEARVDLNRLLR